MKFARSCSSVSFVQNYKIHDCRLFINLTYCKNFRRNYISITCATNLNTDEIRKLTNEIYDAYVKNTAEEIGYFGRRKRHFNKYRRIYRLIY